MSAAFSGANANVLVGTEDVDATNWSLDPEINSFDSTSTADAGWDDETAATSKASGSFDFFYNVAKKPTGAIGGLTPGATPILYFYPDKAVYSGEVFTGKALITKLSLKSKVKDGFIVTASFKSKGQWTYPS